MFGVAERDICSFLKCLGCIERFLKLFYNVWGCRSRYIVGNLLNVWGCIEGFLELFDNVGELQSEIFGTF